MPAKRQISANDFFTQVTQDLFLVLYTFLPIEDLMVLFRMHKASNVDSTTYAAIATAIIKSSDHGATPFKQKILAAPAIKQLPFKDMFKTACMSALNLTPSNLSPNTINQQLSLQVSLLKFLSEKQHKSLIVPEALLDIYRIKTEKQQDTDSLLLSTLLTPEQSNYAINCAMHNLNDKNNRAVYCAIETLMVIAPPQSLNTQQLKKLNSAKLRMWRGHTLLSIASNSIQSLRRTLLLKSITRISLTRIFNYFTNPSFYIETSFYLEMFFRDLTRFLQKNVLTKNELIIISNILTTIPLSSHYAPHLRDCLFEILHTELLPPTQKAEMINLAFKHFLGKIFYEDTIILRSLSTIKGLNQQQLEKICDAIHRDINYLIGIPTAPQPELYAALTLLYLNHDMALEALTSISTMIRVIQENGTDKEKYLIHLAAISCHKNLEAAQQNWIRATIITAIDQSQPGNILEQGSNNAALVIIAFSTHLDAALQSTYINAALTNLSQNEEHPNRIIFESAALRSLCHFVANTDISSEERHKVINWLTEHLHALIETSHDCLNTLNKGAHLGDQDRNFIELLGDIAAIDNFLDENQLREISKLTSSLLHTDFVIGIEMMDSHINGQSHIDCNSNIACNSNCDAESFNHILLHAVNRLPDFRYAASKSIIKLLQHTKYAKNLTADLKTILLTQLFGALAKETLCFHSHHLTAFALNLLLQHYPELVDEALALPHADDPSKQIMQIIFQTRKNAAPFLREATVTAELEATTDEHQMDNTNPANKNTCTTTDTTQDSVTRLFSDNFITTCRASINACAFTNGKLSQRALGFFNKNNKLSQLDDYLKNATTAKHVAFIPTYLYNEIEDSNVEPYREMVKQLRTAISNEIKNHPNVNDELHISIKMLYDFQEREGVRCKKAITAMYTISSLDPDLNTDINVQDLYEAPPKSHQSSKENTYALDVDTHNSLTEKQAVADINDPCLARHIQEPKAEKAPTNISSWSATFRPILTTSSSSSTNVPACP
jgi:hypothetical protein